MGRINYASDAELAPDASLISSIMADPEAAMGLQGRSSALAKAQITRALSPDKLAQAEEQVHPASDPALPLGCCGSHWHPSLRLPLSLSVALQLSFDQEMGDDGTAILPPMVSKPTRLRTQGSSRCLVSPDRFAWAEEHHVLPFS